MKRESREELELRKWRSLSVGADFGSGLFNERLAMRYRVQGMGIGIGRARFWHYTEFLIEHGIYRLCGDLDGSSS